MRSQVWCFFLLKAIWSFYFKNVPRQVYLGLVEMFSLYGL